MTRRRWRDAAGLVGGAAVLAATAAPRTDSGGGPPLAAVWPPMQYGTFGTVPALAAIALARRRPRMAAALAASGTAGWLVAKAVKRVVVRERPAALLDAVGLRGKEEGDLGFPSGHAAVSAALTVASGPYVGGETRRALLALTAFVPFARVYVGAHFPLDVVGGSALGLALGSGVNLILGVSKDGRSTS